MRRPGPIHRLRMTAQILIAEIGASGPENAEDVAKRAADEIHRLKRALFDAQTEKTLIAAAGFFEGLDLPTPAIEPEKHEAWKKSKASELGCDSNAGALVLASQVELILRLQQECISYRNALTEAQRAYNNQEGIALGEALLSCGDLIGEEGDGDQSP